MSLQDCVQIRRLALLCPSATGVPKFTQFILEFVSLFCLLGMMQSPCCQDSYHLGIFGSLSLFALDAFECCYSGLHKAARALNRCLFVFICKKLNCRRKESAPATSGSCSSGQNLSCCMQKMEIFVFEKEKLQIYLQVWQLQVSVKTSNVNSPLYRLLEFISNATEVK